MTEKGNHYFVSAAYNRPLRKIIDFPFLLYRKVLLWRTLDIKIARTEAGIANKR